MKPQKGTLSLLMIPTQNSLVICQIYHMARSARGQDEANPPLWLATRTGMMRRYCLLGIARFVPGIKFRSSPNRCTKVFFRKIFSAKVKGYSVISRSLFAFLWTTTSSQSIKTLKENSANLTSRFFNNVQGVSKVRIHFKKSILHPDVLYFSPLSCRH